MNFAYTARAANGVVSQGEVAATDRNAALNALSRQGLTPVVIKELGEKKQRKLGLASIPLLGRVFGPGKVKASEKIFFSRQLSIMVDAQVPVARAFGLLEKQAASKRMKEVLSGLTQEIESGASISDSLANYPDVFSPVYVNMVKAGEAAGILDQVFDRLATQQEKDFEIVGKVRGASIYPAVITVAAIGAFAFLMTVIVPKLSVIFDSFGTQLPIYTKIMLSISRFLRRDGLYLGGGIAAAIFALIYWHRTAPGKKFFDRLALKSPILGPIIVKFNVARFARTFGALMASGLAVVEALNITAGALGNTMFKEELENAAKQVKNGVPVSEVLEKSKVFPPLVAQMIKVGEETGQVDKVLLKLATFFEKEVDSVVSNLTSVIEPVLIIMLGFMVGSIVLSIFGPISKLTQTLPSS